MVTDTVQVRSKEMLVKNAREAHHWTIHKQLGRISAFTHACNTYHINQQYLRDQ